MRYRTLKSALGLALALAMVALAPTTALGSTTLKVTSGNLTALSALPAAAYSSSKLLYSYGAPKLSAYGSTEYNTSTYYKIGDGQCVTAVKALSNVWKTTSYWIKGGKAVGGGVAAGTVIATFNSSNKYYGHVAIFKGYVKNSSGVITGIEVWDQNWVRSLTFGKHILQTSGSGNGDADNYYVVSY